MTTSMAKMQANGTQHSTPPGKKPFNPNEHMRKLKDQDYLDVKWRLVWFREKFPHGTIDTQELEVDLDREFTARRLVWNEQTRRKEWTEISARGYARYHAVVEDGVGGRATGTKSETALDFPDFVEKAETGAIGRALAGLGLGTQFAPDLDEGERIVDTPVDRGTPPSLASIPSPTPDPRQTAEVVRVPRTGTGTGTAKTIAVVSSSPTPPPPPEPEPVQVQEPERPLTKQEVEQVKALLKATCRSTAEQIAFRAVGSFPGKSDEWTSIHLAKARALAVSWNVTLTPERVEILSAPYRDNRLYPMRLRTEVKDTVGDRALPFEQQRRGAAETVAWILDQAEMATRLGFLLEQPPYAELTSRGCKHPVFLFFEQAGGRSYTELLKIRGDYHRYLVVLLQAQISDPEGQSAEMQAFLAAHAIEIETFLKKWPLT